MRTLCRYKGVEIIEGHLMSDHVHMLVMIPPKLSVSSFMGYLKGKFAHRRRPETGALHRTGTEMPRQRDQPGVGRLHELHGIPATAGRCGLPRARAGAGAQTNLGASGRTSQTAGRRCPEIHPHDPHSDQQLATFQRHHRSVPARQRLRRRPDANRLRGQQTPRTLQRRRHVQRRRPVPMGLLQQLRDPADAAGRGAYPA